MALFLIQGPEFNSWCHHGRYGQAALVGSKPVKKKKDQLVYQCIWMCKPLRPRHAYVGTFHLRRCCCARGILTFDSIGKDENRNRQWSIVQSVIFWVYASMQQVATHQIATENPAKIFVGFAKNGDQAVPKTCTIFVKIRNSALDFPNRSKRESWNGSRDRATGVLKNGLERWRRRRYSNTLLRDPNGKCDLRTVGRSREYWTRRTHSWAARVRRLRRRRLRRRQVPRRRSVATCSRISRRHAVICACAARDARVVPSTGSRTEIAVTSSGLRAENRAEGLSGWEGGPTTGCLL